MDGGGYRWRDGIGRGYRWKEGIEGGYIGQGFSGGRVRAEKFLIEDGIDGEDVGGVGYRWRGYG